MPLSSTKARDRTSILNPFGNYVPLRRRLKRRIYRLKQHGLTIKRFCHEADIAYFSFLNYLAGRRGIKIDLYNRMMQVVIHYQRIIDKKPPAKRPYDLRRIVAKKFHDFDPISKTWMSRTARVNIVALKRLIFEDRNGMVNLCDRILKVIHHYDSLQKLERRELC